MGEFNIRNSCFFQLVLPQYYFRVPSAIFLEFHQKSFYGVSLTLLEYGSSMFLKRKTKNTKKEKRNKSERKTGKKSRKRRWVGGGEGANPAPIKPTGSRRQRPSSHLGKNFRIFRKIKRELYIFQY